ncbi:MAG: hypothetical protein JXR65_08300 [Bacteroidales bacterium]|nr:hypothetical protein [Bacteroidales bacterium]
MLRYLSHAEIDKSKWDRTIEKAFNGNVYAYSWYLDRIHPYWDAIIEGDYERVMPITGSKKWGVNYLFQPFFSQQLGVYSLNILTASHVQDFINNIPDKYRLAEYHLNIHNHPNEKAPYQTIKQRNYLLDLIDDYSKLSNRYGSNTKRNLKKSLKNNFTVTKNVKPERIVKLFRENRGKNIKWSDKHYLRLQGLMYMALHKGKGITYGVFSEQNELSAAAFFLVSHQYITFLFSGVSELGKQSGALTFLIDYVIREFSETQYIMDFEGSKYHGLARFYKGFGAKEVYYNVLVFNKFTFPLKQLVNLWKKMKS